VAAAPPDHLAATRSGVPVVACADVVSEAAEADLAQMLETVGRHSYQGHLAGTVVRDTWAQGLQALAKRATQEELKCIVCALPEESA